MGEPDQLLKMTGDELVGKFVNTMGEFLDALKVVYPECDKVASYEQDFRTTVLDASAVIRSRLGEAAMNQYNTVMSPWYRQCSSCDESLIHEPIEFLDALDLRTKWEDMRSDHKEVIWEVINMLNGLCMIRYSIESLPESMKRVLTSTASTLAEQVGDGEQPDIMGIAQNVIQNINMDDIQDWVTSGNMVINMDTAKAVMSQSGMFSGGESSSLDGIMNLLASGGNPLLEK